MEAEPALRAKAQDALAAQPGRAVTVFAAAPPATRAFMQPLLTGLPPSDLLAGLGEWLAATSAQPSAVMIEFAHQTVQRTEAGSRDRPAALALIGAMLHKAGDAQAAVRAFRQALSECPNLSTAEAASFAEQLFAAAAAAEDRESQQLAVAALITLGKTAAAADMLAATLLDWPAGDAGHMGFVSAVARLAPVAADRLAPLLTGTWVAAARRLRAARRERQGYFADELKTLGAVAGDLAQSLETGITLVPGVDPRLSAVAAAAAQRVSDLLSELVAYQPISPEPLDLRQAVLQVVLACREEAAASGLVLRAGPNGDSGGLAGPQPLEVYLDPALVKGALRQVVLRLARFAAGGAVTPRRGPERRKTHAEAVISARTAQLSKDKIGAVFTVSADVLPCEQLDAMLSSSTVPDIAVRTGGSYSIRPGGPGGLGGAGGSCEITLAFPPLVPPDANRGEAPRPAAAPPEPVIPATVDPGSPAAVRSAAKSLLEAVSAAREHETLAWGGELAVVLHELKNSLAFIGSWLGGGELYDWETIRQRCLENLADVRFWLDEAGVMLSREEQAERPYVDLGELTRRVLRGLAAGMARKRVRLDLHIPGQLPKVPAEPLLAASVIRNLARNALEVTPEGEALSVSVEHVPDLARVSVDFADAGPGFPPEIAAGHDTGATQSGLSRPHLGLLSSRRILADQGGELVLSSEGRGGLAQARFTTGEVAARLAGSVPDALQLAPETRQALRAAAALAASGETETARHIWRKALESESARITVGYRHHRALPVALELVAGKGGRPQLTPWAQSLLAGVFEPAQYSRAESAARSVLGDVLSNRLRPAQLSLRHSAVLMLLVMRPEEEEPGEPARRQAAALLLAAGEALDDDTAPPAGQESAVLDALRAIGSLRVCGPLQ